MPAPVRQRPPVTKEAWREYVLARPPAVPQPMTLTAYRALSAAKRRDYDASRRRHHAALGPYALGRNKSIRDEIEKMILANASLPADFLRPAAAIDGEPTLGKTTLQRLIGKRLAKARHDEFGALTEDGHEYIPVCYVTLPRDSTIKGLNENLAAFYNLPTSKRESANQLSSRVIDTMVKCGTELVLIDDLHFIQPRQLRGRELNDHLKYLMNSLAATFVVAGVGLTETGFFSEGKSASQMRLAQIGQRLRHFAVRRLEIDTDEGLKTWVALLRRIETQLVLLAGKKTLSDRATATYIYQRTGGSIGNVMDLVRLGASCAIEEEASADEPRGLTQSLLDEVTLSFMAERYRPQAKPKKTRRQAA